jgi:hypothetical protein
LGSSVPNASGTNSQRKLVADPGFAALGYESTNEVWVSTATDLTSDFEPEVRISDGTGESSAPSLAVFGGIARGENTGGSLYVVYRRKHEGHYHIFIRVRDASGEWGAPIEFNTLYPLESVNPHPVIGRNNAIIDEIPEVPLYIGGLGGWYEPKVPIRTVCG